MFSNSWPIFEVTFTIMKFVDWSHLEDKLEANEIVDYSLSKFYPQFSKQLGTNFYLCHETGCEYVKSNKNSNSF